MISTILLGVTGGIASYKSVYLASLLVKNDYTVLVIMTRNATRFIAPLTFEAITGNPVSVDMFDEQKEWEMNHLSWSERADGCIIAPATANFIGKITAGIADDMLTTTVLALKRPILIAPAMNRDMYQNKAVQSNINILKSRGIHMIGPEEGYLAEGVEGIGRMSEPDEIFLRIKNLLSAGQ